MAGSKSATRTDNWPKTRNASDYYEFTLYKENKDTMDAIGILSKMLRVPVRSFSFAGTKDKRAVTTQKATVHKVGPRKLAALNSKLIGIRVGDFREAAGHLMLGDLGGNRFSIFLRNVGVGSESTISGALEALKTRGFVNYFGLQRFGSGNTGTHSVGKELLGGRWEEAVRVLLQPKDIGGIGKRSFLPDKSSLC